MSRIKYLILILLSIVFLSSVKAIVTPTDNFYINDYANILSNKTEEYILNKSVALNNVDGTQIVVVTVKNLEGMSIEDYSIRLARSFQIGDAEKDNGLLLLVALEERELRIEVGAGLEGIIPDGKVGRFRDQYMIPYLKDKSWDEGIKNGYDAFYAEIVKQNNLNVEYTEPIEADNGTYIDDDYFEISPFFIFLNVFLGYLIGKKIKKSKKNDRKKYTILYFIFWTILFILSIIYIHKLVSVLFVNLMFFISGRFGNSTSIVGSSRGGSSRSGFSGGGGAFRGGGASGKF